MGRRSEIEILGSIFQKAQTGAYQPTPTEAKVLAKFGDLETTVVGILHPLMARDVKLSRSDLRKVKRYEDLNAVVPPLGQDLKNQRNFSPTYNHVPALAGLDDMLEGFPTFRKH